MILIGTMRNCSLACGTPVQRADAPGAPRFDESLYPGLESTHIVHGEAPPQPEARSQLPSRVPPSSLPPLRHEENGMTSFMRPAVAALAVLCCVTSPARSRAEETPVHKDATSRASAVPKGTPIYFSGVPGKPRDFAIVGTGRNASEAHASAPERTSNPSVDVKQAPSLTANRLTTSVAVSNVALCTAAFDQTQPVLVQDS